MQRGPTEPRTATARASVVVLLATLTTAPAPAMEPMEPGTVTRMIQVEQVSAAVRFGMAQTDHVNGRLRLLHAGHAPCNDRFDIGANIRWERPPSAEETQPAAAGELKFADAFARPRCDRRFAVWADGDIDFGFLRASTAGNRSDFRTSGLTLGADTSLGGGIIVGAAIGYGRNESEVDADGGAERARAQSLALYGKFEPSQVVDIDASVGVGALSFDARRWPATDAETLSVDHGGSQFFGSLAFSADLVAPNVRVAPYARYDYVRSQFDAYGERGSVPAALAYGQMAVSEDALALGFYAGITLTLGPATVEPGLRVEQRRVRSSAFDEAPACSDGLSVACMPRQPADSDDSFGASFSVPVQFGAAASIAFEYSYASSSDALRAESVYARLHAPF